MGWRDANPSATRQTLEQPWPPHPPLISVSSVVTQTTGTSQSRIEELAQTDIVKRLHRIEKDISALKKRLTSTIAVVVTLSSESWELIAPLHITVEQRGDDDFVACLYDIDLYGYGDNIPEALDDLKTVITNQMEFLTGHENRQTEMRISLKKQLNYLKKLLVKTDARY
jgi:hypothetical protein